MRGAEGRRAGEGLSPLHVEHIREISQLSARDRWIVTDIVKKKRNERSGGQVSRDA